jgi:MFS family permease
MTADRRADAQTPTNVEKLRGLPWGVAWSVTNSVFAQYTFFGSIFVLFLNELGLEKAQIGTLLSLLPFFGIVAVFVAATLARIGYKRVFVASFSVRTATAGLLLLAPGILTRFGQEGVLAFIVVAISIFGLARAVGFTAYYPWLQEQVPDALRGKYSAIKNALASLTALLAALAAGYILGQDPPASRFMILIAVGVFLGAVSVWTSLKIPGGAPTGRDPGEQSSYREMVTATRDPNFLSYLVGVGLVTLATVPLVSFIPLFMKEQVGLSSQYVVWLDTGVLLGGLASSYLWGWLADRYGSKPVMVSGVLCLPLMPVAWLLMPRHVSWSLYVALAIALGQGLINTGWGIGSGRLLFVGVVPPEKKTAYMALYYAWMGLAGGLGQLLGGWLVGLSAGMGGRWWIVQFDPYTPLLIAGILLPLAGHLLLRRVRADSLFTTRQFAGMFLRGNPFLALESVVRYHRARDERAAVAMTERLGATRSPLTVEELLGALHDPRFFVRFEAIVAMARHGPDPRTTGALIETLEGDEPALSTLAAWALGRSGDVARSKTGPAADDTAVLEALRRGLDARYRSVQAHCIRSLGNLGDSTVVPTLLARLEDEKDVGLQLALAAALGQLGATQAIDRLLVLLQESRSGDARIEFTLALGRLVGEEHHLISLQRRVASEPGTALSQAVTALKTNLAKARSVGLSMEGQGLGMPGIEQTLAMAADALAQEDLLTGVDLFRSALQSLGADQLIGPCGTVVQECIARLEEFGSRRIEYAVLALHAFDCALVR